MSTRNMQTNQDHLGVEMSYATDVRARQQKAIVDAFAGAAAAIARLPRAIVHWQQQRRLRAELARLDPRLLQDIGIDPRTLGTDFARRAANENGWRTAA